MCKPSEHVTCTPGGLVICAKHGVKSTCGGVGADRLVCTWACHAVRMRPRCAAPCPPPAQDCVWRMVRLKGHQDEDKGDLLLGNRNWCEVTGGAADLHYSLRTEKELGSGQVGRGASWLPLRGLLGASKLPLAGLAGRSPRSRKSRLERTHQLPLQCPPAVSCCCTPCGYLP